MPMKPVSKRSSWRWASAEKMPRIPFTHDTRENLAQFVHWIPRITLVKNHLACWRKKRVHDGEELRSVAPVEKVHCNHAVEVPTGKQAGKVRGRQKALLPRGYQMELGRAPGKSLW